MAAGAETARLRVALLGDGPDEMDWAAELAGREAEAVRAPDLKAALSDGPDLVVVFAGPEDGARIAAELAATPSAPPSAIMIASDARHPHSRLLGAIARGKREWEATFDAIVDPVLLLDGEGRVLRANVGFARHAGLKVQEVVGRRCSDLLGPAYDKDPIAASLADRRSRTEEARYARLAGHQQVTTSPVDLDGDLRLVVILKDVTPLKEQQERLSQAARLADVGLLAAGVAHEINTPLASIALRAESLLRHVEDPRLLAVETFKRFPTYLKTIDEEIFRCKRIIGSLLDFSRSRAPEVRDTDLNALVEKAAELVGHQMRLKQVALSPRLDPALTPFPVDDGQMRQVVIALLMNALDAVPAGGHVLLETHVSAEDAVLAVSDDGPGIPRENMDKVFAPFFTTKKGGQGTGLGLAVCHGIVSAHGGSIRIESEEGRGTRVVVTLPRKRPRADEGGPRK